MSCYSKELNRFNKLSKKEQRKCIKEIYGNLDLMYATHTIEKRRKNKKKL